MTPTNVRTFSFDGLPWIPRSALDRARSASRWIAGLPDRATSAGTVGSVRVRVTAIDLDPGPSSPVGDDPVSFAVVRAEEVGLLRLERGLARACLDAVLGTRLPRLPAPLGRLERGAVSVAAVALLETLGVTAHAALALARPGQIPVGPRVRFLGTLAVPGGQGPFAWDMPVTWLAFPAPAPRPDRLAGLVVRLLAEVAATTLSRAEWARAAPGDAVVFEGCACLDEDRAWPCVARIGSRRARAILDADGSLRLISRFEEGSSSRRDEMSSDRDSTKPGSTGDATPTSGQAPDENAELVASAPVEILAEIGRAQLRGDEVVGLVAGSVIALGPRRRDVVLLRVDGRTWARGELVNVDDELGVRITALLDDR